MNLTCVICAELFGQTDDVHATLCGHLFHQICLMQWLERSKTCPQCRNKCYQKSHHKIYFNIGNLDTSSIDVGSLQQQLEDVKLQNQLSSKEKDKLKKEIEDLKVTRKKCIDTITALETRLEGNKFALVQFSEQVKILKSETKVVEVQRKEITELKRQIELMETLQSVISATATEVEKLLEQDSRPQSLATWVVILKKELRQCESKKAEIRNSLKTVQHDLRKVQEIKRNLEAKISVLESENYQLNTKVEVLEKKVSTENNSNSSTQPCTCNKKFLLNSNNENAIDLNDTFSPGIPQKVKKIEESDSPYLNIRSSNLDLNRILKIGDLIRGKDVTKNKKTVTKPDSIFETNSNFGLLRKSHTEDLSNKYSIFKKPRLLDQAELIKPNSSLVFNGFGGSEKRLLSPTKPLFDDEGKLKTNNINNRLKAGKLKKLPSSTQLDNENSIEKFIKRSYTGDHK